MTRPTYEELCAENEIDRKFGPPEPSKMGRTTAWGDAERRRLKLLELVPPESPMGQK